MKYKWQLLAAQAEAWQTQSRKAVCEKTSSEANKVTGKCGKCGKNDNVIHLLTMSSTRDTKNKHAQAYTDLTYKRHNKALDLLQREIQSNDLYEVVMREGNVVQGMDQHPLAVRVRNYLTRKRVMPRERPRPDLIIALKRGTQDQRRRGWVVDVSFTADKHVLQENEFVFGSTQARKNWKRWDNRGIRVPQEEQKGEDPHLDQRTPPPAGCHEPRAQRGFSERNTRSEVIRGETNWRKGGTRKASREIPYYYPRARYVNKYWELARHIKHGEGNSTTPNVLVLLVGVRGTIPRRTWDAAEFLMRNDHLQPTETRQSGMNHKQLMGRVTAIVHQTVLKIHKVWKKERRV